PGARARSQARPRGPCTVKGQERPLMSTPTLNDEWLLGQARKFLVEHGPPPHPLLRLPTPEEIAAAMRRPLQYGLHHVSHAFAIHRQAVADADERTGEPL